jgi:hypothetical protein
MLVAHDDAIGVIVDLQQFRTPTEVLRETLSQDHGGSGPQTLRP